MKISYAITVCNEKIEVKRLVDFLLANKRQQDEIVVLYDQKNGDEEIATMLTKLNKLPNFQMWRGFFDGHFADWKNKLNEYCTGDYIFQIDADEIPAKFLIEQLPLILEDNQVDLFLVPRVNTVEGLTDEHVKKWRWNVNEKGWVNWPDLQMRIYRNRPELKWQNKVHEVLTGSESHTDLPLDENFALKHPKNINRQEKQNELYSKLQTSMNQTIKELKIIESPNGIFIVDLRDMIGNVLANQGSWEQHLQDFYAHYIEESDHIIDAGANIGYLTVQFAKRCSKVYAFEPQRYVFNQLCANVLLNNLNDKVETYRLALGDKVDTGQLWSIDNEQFGNLWNYGGRGLEWENSAYKSTGEVREQDTVDIVTLDSLNIQKCDLLKLDVQGFEWQLLLGAKSLIEYTLPVILLESAPERSDNDKKVLEYFKNLNYSCYRFMCNNNEDCILVNKDSDRYTKAISIVEKINPGYKITKQF